MLAVKALYLLPSSPLPSLLASEDLASSSFGNLFFWLTLVCWMRASWILIIGSSNSRVPLLGIFLLFVFVYPCRSWIKLPTIALSPSSDSPHKTKLSAYKRPGNLSSPLLKSHSLPPISIFISFITASIYTLKSQGNRIHSCLTPLLILKHSPSPPANIHTLDAIQQFTTQIIHS